MYTNQFGKCSAVCGVLHFSSLSVRSRFREEQRAVHSVINNLIASMMKYISDRGIVQRNPEVSFSLFIVCSINNKKM